MIAIVTGTDGSPVGPSVPHVHESVGAPPTGTRIVTRERHNAQVRSGGA
jgi:galactose-1-phosphate uridylyltransferase